MQKYTQTRLTQEDVPKVEHVKEKKEEFVGFIQPELEGDILQYLTKTPGETEYHHQFRIRITLELSEKKFGNLESLSVGRMLTEKILNGVVYPKGVEMYLNDFM